MNERIKQLRKVLDLSQEQFGAKLGITGASVSRIEAGINNPSESTVLLICSTYHVLYRWITTGEGQMFEDDKEARIDRIIEKGAPNADAVFKAQLKAYATLLSDEDWIIFRDMVEMIRAQKKE